MTLMLMLLRSYIVPNSTLQHTLLPHAPSVLVHPDGDTDVELALGATRDACLARSGVLSMYAHEALQKQADGHALIVPQRRAPASLVAADPVTALKMRYGTNTYHKHRHMATEGDETTHDAHTTQRTTSRHRQRAQSRQSHEHNHAWDATTTQPSEPTRGMHRSTGYASLPVRPVSAPFPSADGMSRFQQHMARARAARAETEQHTDADATPAHHAHALHTSTSGSSARPVHHTRSHSHTFAHTDTQHLPATLHRTPLTARTHAHAHAHAQHDVT